MDAMDKQLRHPVPETPSREREGDAVSHLTPLVAQELRRLEQRYRERDRSRHAGEPTTLVTGALANEATRRSPITRGAVGNRFIDQKHFFTVCARQMRHTLVEHAKEKGLEPRHEPVADNEEDRGSLPAIGASTVIELDQALRQFEQIDAAAALAFELYYFGGHDYKALAVITKVSEHTVQRQLRFAGAWLRTTMQPRS
jgi:RNA polymerase sigma factor (TIGR02999 family)